MERFRLIHRVPPFEHESLSSFLMRAACANSYRRPQDILVFSLDATDTNPQVSLEQVERLADYTRTTVAEIAQLSGLTKRFPKLQSTWQINGQWISRPAFLTLKQTPICPICLSEAAYLRGEWSLIFNTACWRHEIQLISACPRCGRLLTTVRDLPERCCCGFHLRCSPCSEAVPEEIFIAKLIASHSEPALLLDSQYLPAYQVENLARLSLDGLCQSLWFLGHHLCSQFHLGKGKTNQRLRPDEALLVIKAAFWLLSDWPARLGTTLENLLARTPSWSGDNAIIRILGPVQRYYERHISEGDARFIAVPYETYLRQIISSLGRRYRPSRLDSPQTELKFD